MCKNFLCKRSGVKIRSPVEKSNFAPDKIHRIIRCKEFPCKNVGALYFYNFTHGLYTGGPATRDFYAGSVTPTDIRCNVPRCNITTLGTSIWNLHRRVLHRSTFLPHLQIHRSTFQPLWYTMLRTIDPSKNFRLYVGQIDKNHDIHSHPSQWMQGDIPPKRNTLVSKTQSSPTIHHKYLAIILFQSFFRDSPQFISRFYFKAFDWSSYFKAFDWLRWDSSRHASLALKPLQMRASWNMLIIGSSQCSYPPTTSLPTIKPFFFNFRPFIIIPKPPALY